MPSPCAFDLSSIPGLPASALPVLRRFLLAPRPDRSALLQLIHDHARDFERLSQRNEFVDVAQARKLASQCANLLQSLPSTAPAHHHILASLAAQYFVLEEDADSDYDICGLDDDVAVITAISNYLHANRV